MTTRQQRRAAERAEAKQPGKGIVVEHVHSKGYRIKLGGIYLTSRRTGTPQFFETEEQARETLAQTMEKIKEAIQDQAARFMKNLEAAKASQDAETAPATASETD